MKKAVLVVLFVVLGAGLSLALGTSKARGVTLSEEKVKAKWGNTQFDPQGFREGAMEARSKMAASLLRNKGQFIGKYRSEIRKVLGDYSGFYVSGMYPTYLIQETSDKSTEAWQVVFLLDAQSKVSDIVVHKNCCDLAGG